MCLFKWKEGEIAHLDAKRIIQIREEARVKAYDVQPSMSSDIHHDKHRTIDVSPGFVQFSYWHVSFWVERPRVTLARTAFKPVVFSFEKLYNNKKFKTNVFRNLEQKKRRQSCRRYKNRTKDCWMRQLVKGKLNILITF